MSRIRKKEKKLKEREQRVRKKILLKREHANKIRKEEELKVRQELAAAELNSGRRKPLMSEEKQKERDEVIKLKLKKNIEILKKLEEEYQKEKETRQELNEKLEEEGFLDIQSKLEALQKKTLEKLEKSED